MSLDILLSHHTPDEYYKCFKLKIGKQEARICTRCFGFFSSVFFALGVFLTLKPQINTVFYLAACVFFILAYSDWILTKIGLTRSNNRNRFISGISLGLGGAALVYLVLNNFTNMVPYSIGLAFILLAVAVKSISETNVKPSMLFEPNST